MLKNYPYLKVIITIDIQTFICYNTKGFIMTKKRIIAYALAITSLFGFYKGCHKLGEHIRENYLNESFSDSTINNETTINETLSAIIPTETTIIPETTLVEETTPETTFIEETVPETTSNF